MSRGVRYRVIRKIAHGGMAEIFLASQIGAEGFEKPVVLKRILPALASDPAFVRMLVDEAHIVSALNHTHLVQILDLGKADREFFLVLEFVDGFSLEQVRRRARKARLKLPLPLALYITSALCRGLEHVHRHARNGKPLGIVHRDVTPQNVLLGREGDVKLADFGIAKAIGRREKSATGVIKGKFAYMSPEQTIGAELDARSDLFSVGTLLYLLTTGKKPFEAPTDLDVLMQVRRARHEKPSALVRDFNPDVERFIERALRADRARRWQSAEQMADRLDAILLKLGQPYGPATLKRWLEALSARDGIAPPGDVRETVKEPTTGTIQLVSRDLELHQIALAQASGDEELATVWRERAPSPRLELDLADAALDPVEPSQVAASRTDATTIELPVVLLSAAPRAPSNADDPTVFRARVDDGALPHGALALATPARDSSAPEDAYLRDSSVRTHDAVEPASDADEPTLGASDEAASDDSFAEELLPETDHEATARVQPEAGELRHESVRPEAGELRHESVRARAQVEREGEARLRDTMLRASERPLPPPRPRRLRWFAAVGLLLSALLCGSYFAQPFLPPWLVPPAWVELVDSWLARLPASLSFPGARSSATSLEHTR